MVGLGGGGGGGELFLKLSERVSHTELMINVHSCVLLLKLNAWQAFISIPDTDKIGNHYLHISEEETPGTLAMVIYVKQSREQLSAMGFNARSFWLLAMQ